MYDIEEWSKYAKQRGLDASVDISLEIRPYGVRIVVNKLLQGRNMKQMTHTLLWDDLRSCNFSTDMFKNTLDRLIRGVKE